MTYFLIALFVLLIVISAFLKTLEQSNRSKPIYHYARKEFFLTQRETACYKAIVEAVGAEYFVFAQVHLSSLLDERVKRQSWKGARAHINRKSIDFLLCDKENIAPKLAIELDDWSHNRPDRQERDREVERIFSSVGLPLLRITTNENLKEKVAQALNPTTA